jgi:hypothetical protein
MNVFNTGGALAATWTLPTGLLADEFSATRFYANGSFESEDADTIGTATSATLQFTPPSAMVTGGRVDVHALDLDARHYRQRRWLP